MKPLRLLLDQMIDEEVAGLLARIGHDVVRVSEVGLACADDAEILECAAGSGRLLLTLDEHFGDWSILPLSHHPGVIRLKTNPTTTKNVLGLLLPFLEKSAGRDFRNQLVIVRAKRARWVDTSKGLD